MYRVGIKMKGTSQCRCSVFLLVSVWTCSAGSWRVKTVERTRERTPTGSDPWKMSISRCSLFPVWLTVFVCILLVHPKGRIEVGKGGSVGLVAGRGGIKEFTIVSFVS